MPNNNDVTPSPLALGVIKFYEGCVLTVYQDGSAPAVGYGHRDSSLVLGDLITQEQADAFLEVDASDALEMVKVRCGPAYDTLTKTQLAALLSFTYNVGGGPNPVFVAIWTGQTKQVPALLIQHVHDKAGKVLLGLVQRRLTEIQLWQGNIPAQFAKLPLQ